MKKLQISTFIGCLFFFAAPLLLAAQGLKIISPGDVFPGLTAAHEFSPEDGAYLGLSKKTFSFLRKNTVSINNIKADVLILEFLNIHCTSCQEQASMLNSVFDQVSQQHTLKTKVKFLGIGTGNTGRETERFRFEKDVPFPLIPDPDFLLYDAVGNPGGTPFILILKKTVSGYTVTGTYLGLLKNPGFLMKKIEAAVEKDPSELFQTVQPASLPANNNRMLSLKLREEELFKKVTNSMLSACSECTRISNLSPIIMPTGNTVYRGEIQVEGKKLVLFSKIISKKPVCDVCDGIHFIVTFDTRGIIVNFIPLHLTKYGNVAWHAQDIDFMKVKLIGLAIKEGHEFNPDFDAVSMATMSSALIFNGIHDLQCDLKELKKHNDNSYGIK